MHASPEQTPEQPERLRLALLAVALLIALFIVGLVHGGVPEPGRGSTVERATVFDPQIGALLADYGPEMAKVRPGITVESADGSFTVRDCAGYIAMSGRPDRLKQLTGHPLSGAYAVCLPMRLLHDAHGPRNHLGPAADLGRILAERLKPAVLGTLAPDWAGGVRRLADVPADRRSVRDHGMMLTRDDRTWDIEVIGSADFRGRGLEDLLVRISAATGDGYAVLVLGADGGFQMLPADQVLDTAYPAVMAF